MQLIGVIVLWGVSTAAWAYVGPGLGLGVIGAILGALAALFLAIVGVVWYPLKRMFKKRKTEQPSSDTKRERDLQESKT